MRILPVHLNGLCKDSPVESEGKDRPKSTSLGKNFAVMLMPWFFRSAVRYSALQPPFNCQWQTRGWCAACAVIALALCGTMNFAAAQNTSVPVLAPDAPQILITQPVVESRRTVLKGNTHPLARAAFDQGAAPRKPAHETHDSGSAAKRRAGISSPRSTRRAAGKSLTAVSPVAYAGGIRRGIRAVRQ